MAEFPECSWRHQGISLIDWYMFCNLNDHLQSLFDRDWRYGFEPYKLNIYGPGGFSKEHIDHPDQERTVGYLVIQFPTTFTGGDLRMTTGDGGEIRMTADPEKFKFAYFFSSVPQEVEEVTSGCRVTLTLFINRDAVVGALPHELVRERIPWGPKYDDTFLNKLQKLGCLGVLMRGCYTPEDVETRKLDALDNHCDLLLVNY